MRWLNIKRLPIRVLLFYVSGSLHLKSVRKDIYLVKPGFLITFCCHLVPEMRTVSRCPWESVYSKLFKFNLTFLLFPLFRQGSHFLQQPQCFQTRVVLRLDHGTFTMSLTAFSFDFCMSFVDNNLYYFVFISERERGGSVPAPQWWCHQRVVQIFAAGARRVPVWHRRYHQQPNRPTRRHRHQCIPW